MREKAGCPVESCYDAEGCTWDMFIVDFCKIVPWFMFKSICTMVSRNIYSFGPTVKVEEKCGCYNLINCDSVNEPS